MPSSVSSSLDVVESLSLESRVCPTAWAAANDAVAKGAITREEADAILLKSCVSSENIFDLKETSELPDHWLQEKYDKDTLPTKELARFLSLVEGCNTITVQSEKDKEKLNNILKDSERTLVWTLKNLRALSDDKYWAEATAFREKVQPMPLSEYVVQWLNIRFGVRDIVNKMCRDLYEAITLYRTESIEVDIIGSFLDEEFDAADFSFYLYARNCCVASMTNDSNKIEDFIRLDVAIKILLRLFAPKVEGKDHSLIYGFISKVVIPHIEAEEETQDGDNIIETQEEVKENENAQARKSSNASLTANDRREIFTISNVQIGSTKVASKLDISEEQFSDGEEQLQGHKEEFIAACHDLLIAKDSPETAISKFYDCLQNLCNEPPQKKFLFANTHLFLYFCIREFRAETARFRKIVREGLKHQMAIVLTDRLEEVEYRRVMKECANWEPYRCRIVFASGIFREGKERRDSCDGKSLELEPLVNLSVDCYQDAFILPRFIQHPRKSSVSLDSNIKSEGNRVYIKHSTKVVSSSSNRQVTSSQSQVLRGL